MPSYLGTSASFVGGVFAITGGQGGDLGDVTGAILVAGVVLFAVGAWSSTSCGSARASHAVLPPVVTGAVVMLIGFNLAPVVANVYWPQDQWIALLIMIAVVLMPCCCAGSWAGSRSCSACVFGYALSLGVRQDLR